MICSIKRNRVEKQGWYLSNSGQNGEHMIPTLEKISWSLVKTRRHRMDFQNERLHESRREGTPSEQAMEIAAKERGNGV
jgi:hypothetical protein